jgi:DHA2 family multidrug resistance protein-like MFS transporter
MSAELQPHPRRWAGLSVLSLSLLVVMMDMTILNVALPELALDLRPTSVQLLWIVDVYSLVVAGLLVTASAIGDRIGRRRLLIAGYTLFGVASLLVVLVDGAGAVIALRALLGVGGAMIMPATLAMIRTMFTDARERAVALGVWASVAGGGAGLGPIVGGALLETFSWQAAFLVNVPLMVVAIVAALPLLPESRSARPARIDGLGVALSLGGMAALLYAIKRLGKHGIELPTLAIGAAALVALGLFVRHCLRADEPMLDVRLFAGRRFRAGTITAVCSMFAIGVLFLLGAQYLQLVEGKSPLVAGLWLLPMAVAAALGSLAAPFLARRIGDRETLAGGLWLCAGGLLLMFVLPLGLGTLTLALTVVGLGTGALAIASGMIMSDTPADKAGSAAAIEETSYEIGMALSVSILGSVAAAIYRSGLPEGAGAEVRESLAGALGDPAVFGAAAQAFTDGLVWTGLVGAIAVAGAAWAVWRLAGTQAPGRLIVSTSSG